MLIKNGDKVRVNTLKVDNNVGIVEHVISTMNLVDENHILIVRLDGGELIKCMEDDITKIEESEDIKKDEITITREEYFKAVVKVVDPFNLEKIIDDPENVLILSLSGMVIAKEIEKELFGDPGENA